MGIDIGKGFNDIKETFFGSGDSPSYGGAGPSVDTQKDWYAGQDKQNFDPNKMMQGIPQDIQMPEAKTFSQSAIQNRVRNQYGDYLNDMRSKNERLAQEELQRQRMNNMDFVSKVRRLVNHVQERRYVAMQNEAAARNRVIGNILGAGGMVAGGIIGAGSGNPMLGAYAGGKIGSGLAGPQEMQLGPRYSGSSGGYGNYGAEMSSVAKEY